MAGHELDRRLAEALPLVDAEAFDEGASALRELLPELDGRPLFDALVTLGRAMLWTEHTEEAFACAERSLELAERGGDRDLRGPRPCADEPGARPARGGG